jgi:hypothetical protein
MTRMHRDPPPRTAAIEKARRALFPCEAAVRPGPTLTPASDEEQARRARSGLLDGSRSDAKADRAAADFRKSSFASAVESVVRAPDRVRSESAGPRAGGLAAAPSQDGIGKVR